MSVAAAPPEAKKMTIEEFLALPDDGRERWLIRGELRPREPGMSVRNWRHGRVESFVAKLLGNWLDDQPESRGEVVSGDTGFRLLRTADSLVGVGVAYVSAEVLVRTDVKTLYFDGPPSLAVEILSPSDKHEEVVEKIGEYLEAGVIVWEIDPDFRTVRVHRPGQEPETFNALQELSGEPYLPGFRMRVADLFGW